MNVKWYGHSCFLLTGANGVRILIDPCDKSTGYELSNIEADVVTSSHDHHDHNYFAAAAGNPIRIDAPGEYTVGDVRITGIPTWHDDQEGKLRGRNIVFIFEIDGMRVCHLGDLGHMLDEETLAKIGKLDVLLAPVGGTYTIDHVITRKIANALNASVLIPMHYKTNAVNLDIVGVQQLLTEAQNCAVHRLNQSDCILTKESLGEDRLLVLDYTKQG